MSKDVNYDLVRATEKITKGLDWENGLGLELLGHYGSVSGEVYDLMSAEVRNRESLRINGYNK